jgi:hypothetical protein
MLLDKITVYAVHESTDMGMHVDTGDFLNQFTSLTGGVTLTSDNTDAAISQALSDSRVNYSVTYRLASRNWDGKFHKVRLKSRRRGVRLRSINGYYAIDM